MNSNNPSSNSNSSFAKNLLELRERAGLSRYALAKATGVDASLIGRYERNEREPRASQITKLAVALECTVGQLLGLETINMKGTIGETYEQN